MNDAPALLAEVRRCGGLVYRIGDRVRVRPVAALPAGLLERLRSHKRELLEALPDGHVDGEWLGIRMHSRVLDAYVWLAADDGSAEQLEVELQAEGNSEMVFTLSEVFAMKGMLVEDMRRVARIKSLFAGARIDSVTTRSRA